MSNTTPDFIFNTRNLDLILGIDGFTFRDFLVYNYRDVRYQTGGEVVFSTTKTTYNTQQGFIINTSGGNVVVDPSANLSVSGNATISGNITTPVNVSANQGTFTTSVTTALITATVGQFQTFSSSTKLFDIPHPQKSKMRLRHGSLEGPELGVYVRGKSTNNIINLPDYWEALVDPQTITVHLTPTRNNQFLYVTDVSPKYIKVQGVTAPFYFMIMAERKDIPKLEIETYA
jgi:hypothetical protein